MDNSITDNNKGSSHTRPEAAPGIRIDAGPFVGIVKSNIDPLRSGRLLVWIEGLSGKPEDSSAWRTVMYASPFYGVTPPPKKADGKIDLRPNTQDFMTNPHSYGFWFTSPDIGTKIICTFIKGDPEKGYWFGCIPDWPNLHMVPAISGNDTNPLPLVEYNADYTTRAELSDFATKDGRPAHREIVNQLQKQGLSGDKERGLITSSAFRESPSAVFGFSTPGRSIDPSQSSGGSGAVVSDMEGGASEGKGYGRKGGHSFVLDDGDDQGINQLIRLRSATGHQITMHDTSGFIYIVNATGTAWLEMDSAGAINVYSDTDIKFGAKNNIFFEAKNGSIKMNAKASMDLVTDGTLNATGKGAVNINSDKDTKVTGKEGLHLKGKNTYLTGDNCIQVNGGKHLDLGAGCINLNSSKPTAAKAASSGTPPAGMPTHEPWSGHKKGPGGRGSGTTKSLPYGNGEGVAGAYGKAADYSGVSSNSKNIVQSSTIGSTGGSTPGATGFRQGTEAAPVSNNFGGSGGVGDYRGYPNLNGQQGVGSGQCVALVTAYSDAGPVSTWRPADNRTLFDNPPQPGACIATLDKGYYANQTTGNHAAIYLGQGEDSRGRYILVQEQNVARDAAGNKVIGERRIYEKDGGSDSNNAKTYRVIANDKNPKGVNVRNAPPVKQETEVKENSQDAKAITGPEPDKRADVNSPEKGFISPEQEAANREQLKKENEAGGDFGPPILESEASKASRENQEKIEQDIKQSNTDVNYAQARYDSANTALKDNEDALSRGQIDPAEYRARAAELQSEVNAAKADLNAAKTQNDALGSDAGNLGTDLPGTSFDRDQDYSAQAREAEASKSETGNAVAEVPNNNSYEANYPDSSTGADNINTSSSQSFDAQQTINDQRGGSDPDIYGGGSTPLPTKEDVTPPEVPGEPSFGPDAIDGGADRAVTGTKNEPGQGGVQGPAGAPQNNTPNASQGPAC